jgi:hypothetical protein
VDDDDEETPPAGPAGASMSVGTIYVEVPLYTEAELEELISAASDTAASAIRLRSIARRHLRVLAEARARWGTAERRERLRVVTDLDEKTKDRG